MTNPNRPNGVPLYLTLGRLLAPLAVCPLIFMDQPGLAVLVFALAAFTDWLDGFLARRWHETSVWGQVLDPVADKVLMVLTLFALAAHGDLGWVGLSLTFLLIFREIAITALRQNTSIAVKGLSKVKTLLQGLAIGGLILGGWWGDAGIFLLFISLILGYFTAWQYLREALK